MVVWVFMVLQAGVSSDGQSGGLALFWDDQLSVS